MSGEEEEKRIRDIVKDELDALFSRGPYMVNPETHYKHHQHLSEGCMKDVGELKTREDDHTFIREIRGAGGKVRKEALVWGARFGLLAMLAGVFYTVKPALMWIVEIVKAASEKGGG